MNRALLQGCAALVSVCLATGPAFAQGEAPPLPVVQTPSQGTAANAFSAQQLDSLLAPIALYPDQLLMQVLMAATNPLQIVAASRWLGTGNNKSLQGEALAKALDAENWDPAVKSIVPFPQVLEMMNQNLEWTQQLGYAVASQQSDVMDSIQRLRQQAKAAGSLETTAQQVITSQPALTPQGAPSGDQVIVIQPANPQTVFVPVYNPTQVFGTWPYPAYPPVALPPPPGYAVGNALLTGLAFGAGVAVVGSLWGWATPRWGGGGWGGGSWNRYGGSINVNNVRYNRITVNNPNRGTINNGRWNAPPNGAGRFQGRPPGGPVGNPGRGGLGANAIGRPNVQIPSGALNRPNMGANRPNAGQGTNRPGGPQGGINRPGGPQGGINRPGGPQGGINRPGGPQGGINRPGGPQGGINRPGGQPGGINRPNAPQGGFNRPNAPQGGFNRPSSGGNRPNFSQGGMNRPPGGAFGGMQDGGRAQQFQQRGAQSRQSFQSRPAPGGGGGFHRGGGGGGGGGRRR